MSILRLDCNSVNHLVKKGVSHEEVLKPCNHVGIGQEQGPRTNHSISELVRSIQQMIISQQINTAAHEEHESRFFNI